MGRRPRDRASRSFNIGTKMICRQAANRTDRQLGVPRDHRSKGEVLCRVASGIVWLVIKLRRRCVRQGSGQAINSKQPVMMASISADGKSPLRKANLVGGAKSVSRGTIWAFRPFSTPTNHYNQPPAAARFYGQGGLMVMVMLMVVAGYVECYFWTLDTVH